MNCHKVFSAILITHVICPQQKNHQVNFSNVNVNINIFFIIKLRSPSHRYNFDFKSLLSSKLLDSNMNVFLKIYFLMCLWPFKLKLVFYWKLQNQKLCLCVRLYRLRFNSMITKTIIIITIQAFCLKYISLAIYVFFLICHVNKTKT